MGAFMSTSRNRRTPIHYMGSEENILWDIEAGPESDTGYHCGADIKMLSQYAAEDEVLFPPCTMLKAKKSHGPRGQFKRPSLQNSVGDLDASEKNELGKNFLTIKVVP